MNIFVTQFFVWWYSVRLLGYIRFLKFTFVYLMTLTRGLPMWQNLGAPLFGDISAWGRLIGPVIRFWWAMGATIICIFVILPLTIFAVLLVILPILPLLHLLYIVL